MKYGVKIGIVLLVLGAIVVGFNLIMINDGKYYPKLLIVGPCLGLLGLGYILFKGGDFEENTPTNMKNKLHWKNAPMLSKVMWVVFAIGGMGIGFWWMVSLGGM